jgi:hydrogenase nickel incorporation protein HypA/HybF
VHEGALAQAALDLVLETAREHGAEKVTSITLSVGALAQANGDSLAFWLGALAEGSPAEGATIDVVEVAAEGECQTCRGARYPVEPPGWSLECPVCGRGGELVAGRELTVSSIEVE